MGPALQIAAGLFIFFVALAVIGAAWLVYGFARRFISEIDWGDSVKTKGS